MSTCPSSANASEHAYDQPREMADRGVVVQWRFCMMCGRSQMRVRNMQNPDSNWGEWQDVDDKG